MRKKKTLTRMNSTAQHPMLHGAWETPCTHYKVTTDLTLHISNALRACVRARAVTCSLHPPKYVVILTGSRIASHRSAFETTR